MSADAIRSRIERGEHDREAFRAALSRIPPPDRDAWWDRVLGLGELSEDAADLPRGCVPYFPSSVDVLLRLVERARVTSSDVFIDVGAGVGRAAVLVHLLTGASVIGIEVQSRLVCAAREMAERLALARVAYVEGDAATQPATLAMGTVFFLYCPFSGDRLTSVVGDLDALARTRPIRVCCLDLPLPACGSLVREPSPAPDLAVYRSRPVACTAPT